MTLGTLTNKKKLVEVSPLKQQQLNESHLELSPIDLKESNRDDISRKLDELYKSYELKEKKYNDEDSSNKNR